MSKFHPLIDEYKTELPYQEEELSSYLELDIPFHHEEEPHLSPPDDFLSTFTQEDFDDIICLNELPKDVEKKIEPLSLSEDELLQRDIYEILRLSLSKFELSLESIILFQHLSPKHPYVSIYSFWDSIWTFIKPKLLQTDENTQQLCCKIISKYTKNHWLVPNEELFEAIEAAFSNCIFPCHFKIYRVFVDFLPEHLITNYILNFREIPNLANDLLSFLKFLAEIQCPNFFQRFPAPFLFDLIWHDDRSSLEIIFDIFRLIATCDQDEQFFITFLDTLINFSFHQQDETLLKMAFELIVHLSRFVFSPEFVLPFIKKHFYEAHPFFYVFSAKFCCQEICFSKAFSSFAEIITIFNSQTSRR